MSTPSERRVPLDIVDLPPGRVAPARPWIGVHFVCSGRYVRVHRQADGRGYLARCPACGRCARFRVAPGGMEQRFFEVSC